MELTDGTSSERERSCCETLFALLVLSYRITAAAQTKLSVWVVSNLYPSNPSGYSSSMNFVDRFPSSKRRLSITERKKGILCCTPAMRYVSNALLIVAMAFALSSPYEHNLEI